MDELDYLVHNYRYEYIIYSSSYISFIHTIINRNNYIAKLEEL
ncbi:hypothetical protein MJ1_0488 [Nanobdella aerobiophila]|uniref:Uncharacterized protein n=1 Tax=Nanobdella aerobiophila TaxID=2586965 RepID=A0A915SCT0_9ARCH|nr:hypothetical protein [Nanobdella aerobiophila]BBL45643.1 hypothetical protein MJ1_0488 [Nanobdella aerobiophila]